MKRGWFKEYHRHSLAARGIPTSRYHARKGGITKRRMFTQNPEELMKAFVVSDLPKEDQERVKKLRSDVERLRERRDKLVLEAKALPGEDVSADEFQRIMKARTEGMEAREELKRLRNTRKMLRARKKAFEDTVTDLRNEKEALEGVQGKEDELRRVEEKLARFESTLEDDLAKVDAELEVVDDKLEFFEGSGQKELAEEFKEANQPNREELREVKQELREKMDELDKLTGVGRRRAVTAGEDAGMLPREKIVKENRSSIVKRLENLQKLDETRREKELKEYQRQLQQAREALRDQRDSGSITAAQFRRASNDLDERQLLMQTALEFQQPREIRRESLGTLPRRTTKRDREIITRPTKVNIAERAEKQKKEKRERELRSKRVARQAEVAKRDMEGQSEDN